METYSLFQLNEYLRRVIALNFGEHIWIKAELLNISESRGNYYLELIEKEEGSDQVIAKSSAVIWYRSYLSLQKRLGQTINSLLKSGVELKVRVKVDFSERYGLKLVIDDIDPSFTLGQLELQRQKIIERLQSESLIGKNALIDLPDLCQRIAVISSSNAAGYQDFKEQILGNAYGFAYQIDLFESAVQGTRTKIDTIKALADIRDHPNIYDCVVIVRGGGSKLDLSGYDDYDICLAIAEYELPVITAIGHEIDTVLVDLVSHTDLKTPTAAADFLIEKHLILESRTIDMTYQIKNVASELVNKQLSLFEHSIMTINNYCTNLVEKHRVDFDNIESDLAKTTQRLLDQELQNMEQMKSLFELSQPSQTIKRGFARVMYNGRYIDSTNGITKEDLIAVELKSGTIESRVIRTS